MLSLYVHMNNYVIVLFKSTVFKETEKELMVSREKDWGKG